MRSGRNRIQPFFKHQQRPNLSNFYGVDSEMLSSEKSIFENYNCGDPCQRKNAAVMVKTMHQNGLHDILPVLYKVASILTFQLLSSVKPRVFRKVLRMKDLIVFIQSFY